MKKIIILIFIVLFSHLSLGLNINSTNYNMDFVVSSGLMNENTSTYNTSMTLGETPIGDQDYNSYDAWYGLQFNYTGTSNITTGETSSEEDEEEPSGGEGSSGGIQVNPTECNWNITPKYILFDMDNLKYALNITNHGEFDSFIEVHKTYVPTIFGAEDLLSIEKENFYLENDQSKLFNVELKDIRFIRENTTVFLNFESGANCKNTIPLYITEVPPTFYDLKINIKKAFYSIGNKINFDVKIINKGSIPDKDSILKLYIIEPNGEKRYFYEEILYEVNIGETLFEKEYILGTNDLLGKYFIGVEYETKEQGLLRAEDSFQVVQPHTLVLLNIVYYASALVIIIIIFLLLKRNNKKENEI